MLIDYYERGTRIKLIYLKIILVLFFSVFCFSSSSFSEEKIIAKIGDGSIISMDIEVETARLIPKTYLHGAVSEEKKKAARKQAFENIRKRELLYSEALRRGLLPEKDEINRREQEDIKKFGTKENLEDILAKNGMTIAYYRDSIKKELAVDNLIRKEVFEKSVVTDEEIKEFYKSKIDSFKGPDRLRVFHIMIGVDPSSDMKERDKALRLAEDIVKRAKAGEDFSQLALQYSKDDYRVKGGDLGFVHRGMLEPEIEALAFSLHAGEAGGPVKTMYGYSIIKAGEKVPGETPSFENVKEKAKRQLISSKREENYVNLLNSLTEKIKMEIFDPEFR